MKIKPIANDSIILTTADENIHISIRDVDGTNPKFNVVKIKQHGPNRIKPRYFFDMRTSELIIAISNISSEYVKEMQIRPNDQIKEEGGFLNNRDK